PVDICRILVTNTHFPLVCGQPPPCKGSGRTRTGHHSRPSVHECTGICRIPQHLTHRRQGRLTPHDITESVTTRDAQNLVVQIGEHLADGTNTEEGIEDQVDW